ncbi:MAG: CHAD domain-containing protein [Candidatus Eiseniibacteriota bacterium]
MLNLSSFLKKLNENLQRVDRRVNKYLKDSNAKQIHDVRTAIRRLEASFLTLPKKHRTATPLADYVFRCKEFFKINSEIRDFDIISEKLQKYSPNPHRDRIIEELKVIRSTKLEHARALAISLKKTDLSYGLENIDITEKQLQKRYNKILSKLISKLESTFPIVLNNYSGTEELHDLRIACKKLRYMLELLPEENQSGLQIRKTLQRLQDMLGAIHDYDFTTDYLASVGDLPREIQEIVRAESEERRLRFEKFLKYCKRRLGISRNSFLIILRGLKLLG